jgi:hypothetical protein
MRCRTAAGLLAGSLVVLAACTAPEEFTGREALPTCPVVELDQGEELPADAQACLDAGLANGRGAELKVSRPTTEGDPIVDYYRVVPGQPGYEIFSDATRDSYGPATWTRSLCPEALSVVEIGDCTETELG